MASLKRIKQNRVKTARSASLRILNNAKKLKEKGLQSTIDIKTT